MRIPLPPPLSAAAGPSSYTSPESAIPMSPSTPATPASAFPFPQTPTSPSASTPVSQTKTLFDAGLKCLTPGPTHNPRQAFAKFSQALNKADRSSSGYNWYAEATCLNNMSIAKRQSSEFEEAAKYNKDAWAVAIRALFDERELLLMQKKYFGDSWMDHVIGVLDLDQHEVWISHSRRAYSEDGEYSGINLYDGTTDEGKGKQPIYRTSESNEAPSSDESVRRMESFKSAKSATSSNIPGLLQGTNKTIHGPPVVVIFLDLLTNNGNILFETGDLEAAITCHANCLRLAESMLELFPLEVDFRMSFPLSLARRLSAAMTGVIPPDHDQLSSNTTSLNDRDFFFDPNYPTPTPTHRIRLSYLHRSLINAQARSLTHLGLCCQALGLDDAAIQCNSHAYEIIAFYKKYTVVGSIVPGMEVKPPEPPESVVVAAEAAAAASAAESKVERQEFVDELSSSSSIRDVETESVVAKTSSKKNKIVLPLVPWLEAQKEMMVKTNVYFKEVVDPTIGAILGNFAASFYAKGRIAAAFDYLVDSSSVFREIGFAEGVELTNASISALKVDFGRSLKNLHWAKQMELLTAGRIAQIEECALYWTKLGIETAAREHYGAAWTVPGWKGLKQSFLYFKEKDNLFSMLVTMLNMVSAQITNNQPYVALYILGNLMTESTRSGLSLSTTKEAQRTLRPELPETLKLHAHFLYCQTIYLLQRHIDPLDFPKLIINIRQDFYLDMSLDGLNILARALNPEITDPLNLETLVSTFSTQFQALDKMREEVVQSVPYSFLYFFIGASGFYTLASSMKKFVDLTLDNRANKNPHLYGIGVGIDMKMQQYNLVLAIPGKQKWVEVVNSDDYENMHRNYTAQKQKLYDGVYMSLDIAAKEALDKWRDNSEEGSGGRGMVGGSAGNNRGVGGSSSVVSGGFMSPSTRFIGFVPDLYKLGPILRDVAPIVGGVSGADGMGRGSNAPPVSRYVASIQASFFCATGLLSVSSDVLVNSAYLIQQGSRYKEDIVLALKIKEDGSVQPDVMMGQLLDACGSSYRGGLGMCDSCLRMLLEEVAVWSPEIAFVSTKGIVVRSEAQEENNRGLSQQFVREQTEQESKVFPCRHYYVG
ncbi:hypothetical protein HDU79_010981 [Rhizoclosmatium sp. JEL0117]|nr:hypothetical protein HDU79_010981 [Rhizoclosmatium sp. JEL0117]